MSLLHKNMAADALYAQAAKLVIETQNAGIIPMSRELRCGFGCAARMVDQLCRDGVVSRTEADGKRRVLMTALPEHP